MKKIIIPLVAGVLLVHGTQAAVQSLPFVDHFNYAQGNLPAVAPAGVWDISGQSGVEITVQTNSALTAPQYFNAASGNGVKWTPSGSARRAIVQFPSTSSGELYASFLLNVVSAPSSARMVAYFDDSTSQPSSGGQLGFFVGNGLVGIAKNSSTVAATVSIGSGTHLIVLRYTFTGTSTDQNDLWVDPTNTTYSASNAPPAMATTSAGGIAAIPYFGIYAASGAGPSLNIDEVRIGTTWADVVPGTPPTPPPPPATNVVAITQVSPDPAGFVIQGVGGTSNGVFHVLASTDLTIPVSSWNSIGTFNFDVNGNFSCTNPVPDGTDFEFFAVHVGSAVTNTPPSITSQPGDQMVLIGQPASFTVTADGTLPLIYQWSFNTNTVLTAGTNAMFTISSVSSNDVGGYSVVVSNNFGSVTSVVASLTLGEPITNGNFYVANNGTDTNDGSFQHPFYNIQKAADLAQPGNTIYVRGGIFPYVNMIRLQGHPGTANALIKLWAYPGEHPVLDFSSQPIGSSNRGIFLTNDYWHVKGLDVGHAGDNGLKLEGSHNIIEQCVFHENQDSGLQIGFGHPYINDGTMASYNTVINCDSYDNYDNATHGGNADGFSCKMHPGPGNMFIGCRAWYNSDDGWDLFETDYSVVISNCWAWKSGYLPSGATQGNGNGFKMGGNGTGGDSKGTHYAYNCVAFGCKVNNFDQNSHKDGDVVVNCLAFSPGSSGYNYFFEGSLNTGKTNIFENDAGIPRSGTSGNISFDNNPLEINNSWNLSVTVSSADFGDITEAAAGAPRQADGSLPTGFARLVSGSDLIDKGSTSAPYSNTYCGTAPDLGAFEYCP